MKTDIDGLSLNRAGANGLDAIGFALWPRVGGRFPWRWLSVCLFRNRRALIAMLALLDLGFCLAGVDAVPKPALSFNLAATNGWFGQNIGKGLRLRVERDELGWEVCVYKQGSSDNLLLPRGNWHGPQLCQIYTWMPRNNIFGDDRVIPIHGSKQSIRIRIYGATASGKPGSERFTGGRVEIFLK